MSGYWSTHKGTVLSAICLLLIFCHISNAIDHCEVILSSDSSDGEGTMTVHIYPESIRGYENARWRPVGTTIWYRHNDIISRPDGDVEVEFDDVPGWTTPPNTNALSAHWGGDPNPGVGTYILINKGNVQIYMNPAGIGGMWRFADESTWYGHQLVTDVDVGRREIIFKELPGYVEPKNTFIDVIGGQLNQYSFKYEKIVGSVSVDIFPEEVRPKGAAWTLKGVDEDNRHLSFGWKNSGQTLMDVPIGNYLVQFKYVKYWQTPLEKKVTVKFKEHRTLQGKYAWMESEISGRVLNENGTPRPYVPIKLLDQDTGRLRIGMTGGGGEYRIPKISVGNYLIFPMAKTPGSKDFIKVTPSFRNVAVETGATINNADFTVSQESGYYGIVGKLETPSGVGIANERVYLSNGDYATSDENGLFAFSLLHKQRYAIHIFDSLKLDVLGSSLGGYRGKRVSSSALQVSAINSLYPSSARVEPVKFIARRKQLSIRGNVLARGWVGVSHGLEVKLLRLTDPYDELLYGGGRHIEVGKQLVKDDSSFRFADLVSGKYIVEIHDPTDMNRKFLRDKEEVTINNETTQQMYFVLVGSDLERIDVNGLSFWAEKFQLLSNSRYRATGKVYIGAKKYLYLEDTGDSFIFSSKDGISGIQGSLSLPTVSSINSIFSGNLNIRPSDGKFVLGNTTGFNDFAFKYEGITFKPSSYNFYEDQYEMVASIERFPFVENYLKDAQRRAEFTWKPESGFELSSFNMEIDSKKLFGNWYLKDFAINYDKYNGSFKGTGTVKNNLMEMSGYLSLYDGDLDYVAFNLRKDLWLKYPYLKLTQVGGTYLNRVKIAYLTGHLVFSPKNSPIDVLEGDVSAFFFSNNAVNMYGNGIKFLKMPVDGEAKVRYVYSGPDDQDLYKAIYGDYLFAWVDFDWGSFVNFEASADDILIRFGKVYISGDLDASIGVSGYKVFGTSADFVVDDDRIKINVSAALDYYLDTLRFSATVDNGYFYISSPTWITGTGFSISSEKMPQIEFFPTTDDYNETLEVADNLAEVQFIIMADQGMPKPVLFDPAGNKVNLSKNNPLLTIKKSRKYHGMSIRMSYPQGGKWRVNLENKDELGKVFVNRVEYTKAPGISFASITDQGNNEFMIELARSNFPGEKVEISITNNANGKGRRLLATEADLDSENRWTLDASVFQPGEYYLFARVMDDTYHSYETVSENPIVVEGDLPEGPIEKPEVRVRKKTIQVKWDRLDDPEITGYYLEFDDLSNIGSEATEIYVDPEADSFAVPFDSIKAGRVYNVSVRAKYSNGFYSKPSAEKKLRFKLNKENNLPYFTTTPENKVVFGAEWQYKPVCKDMDRDSLAFSVIKGPEGLVYDIERGMFTWIPENNGDLGINKVKVIVTDSKGGSEEQTFKLFVLSPDNEGQIENSVITDSNGNRKHLITYFNRDINDDAKLYEKVGAEISSSSLGTIKNIVLKELPNRPGMFVAEVPEESLYKEVRKLASSRVQAAAEMAKPIIVKIKGKKGPKRVLAK